MSKSYIKALEKRLLQVYERGRTHSDFYWEHRGCEERYNKLINIALELKATVMELTQWKLQHCKTAEEFYTGCHAGAKPKIRSCAWATKPPIKPKKGKSNVTIQHKRSRKK